MRTSILAIPERKSVIDDVIYELEKNGVEVLNKNLEFSLSNLSKSDFIIARRDQRSPEIWLGIGFSIRKNIPIISYWNLKTEPPKYGFYGIMPFTITDTKELTEVIKKIEEKEFKRKEASFNGFQNPPNFYIAGDVRCVDKTGYFSWMEYFLKKHGFNAINPQKEVDNYDPYKMYFHDLSALPIDKFQKVKPGSKGASYCFELIDKVDGIITRVDDESNIGPWMETGYAIGAMKPVIGIHKYPWPKSGKYEVVPGHAVDWEAIREISNYNKEKFNINRWVAETQRDLIEILNDVVSTNLSLR
jgi:nucleoside 2-deoxyribosyltransferase